MQQQPQEVQQHCHNPPSCIRTSQVPTGFICHLCRGSHYYSQCSQFHGDIVCFYNELDENIYLMHHPCWPVVTIRDVFTFISRMLRVMPHQVRLVVGDAEIDPVVAKRQPEMPAYMMYIVPGMTVSVFLLDRYKFLAGSGPIPSDIPRLNSTSLSPDHDELPAEEAAAPDHGADREEVARMEGQEQGMTGNELHYDQQLIPGSVASTMPSSVPAMESANTSLLLAGQYSPSTPIATSPHGPSAEAASHQHRSDEDDNVGGPHEASLSITNAATRLVSRLQGRLWADISSDTAATTIAGESPPLQVPVTSGAGEEPSSSQAARDHREAAVNIRSKTIPPDPRRDKRTEGVPLSKSSKTKKKEEAFHAQQQQTRQKVTGTVRHQANFKIVNRAATADRANHVRQSRDTDHHKTELTQLVMRNKQAKEAWPFVPESPAVRLHIKFIPLDMTLEALSDLLTPFGDIVCLKRVEPKLLREGDPLSFCFAFVDYASQASADACRKAMHKMVLGNLRLSVSISLSKKRDDLDDKAAMATKGSDGTLTGAVERQSATQEKARFVSKPTRAAVINAAEDASTTTTNRRPEGRRWKDDADDDTTYPSHPTERRVDDPPRTPPRSSISTAQQRTPTTEPRPNAARIHREQQQAPATAAVTVATSQHPPQGGSQSVSDDEKLFMYRLQDIVNGAIRCCRELVTKIHHPADSTPPTNENMQEEEKHQREAVRILSTSIALMNELVISQYHHHNSKLERDVDTPEDVVFGRARRLSMVQHVRLLQISAILCRTGVVDGAESRKRVMEASVLALDLSDEAAAFADNLPRSIPSVTKSVKSDALAHLAQQLFVAGMLFEHVDLSMSALCYSRGLHLAGRLLGRDSSHVVAMTQLLGRRTPSNGRLMDVVLPGVASCTALFLSGRIQISFYTTPSH